MEDTYCVHHSGSPPEDTIDEVAKKSVVTFKDLSKEEIREQFAKMQIHARCYVAQLYKHISSQASTYNGRWQNEVTTRYHLDLANKCQVVTSLLPHSLDKVYKSAVINIFTKLEDYFRTCGIKGKRIASGPGTYEVFKRRIDSIW